MGLRLGANHPMGPLALADLIGLDTCLAVMHVLHKGLGDDKYRCALLRALCTLRRAAPRCAVLRVSPSHPPS